MTSPLLVTGWSKGTQQEEEDKDADEVDEEVRFTGRASILLVDEEVAMDGRDRERVRGLLLLLLWWWRFMAKGWYCVVVVLGESCWRGGGGGRTGAGAWEVGTNSYPGFIPSRDPSEMENLLNHF